MKKVHIAVLVVFALILSASVAWAGGPAIFINGNQLVTDDPAVIEDGRTLLPMRAMFESVGQAVYWDGETQTVTSGDIVLQINNNVATVGDEEVALDVPAKLINDRTYVPLRFVAENLGKEVKWDGEQNRVDINDVVENDEDAAVVDEDAAVVDEDAAVVDEDAAVVDEDAAVVDDGDAVINGDEESGTQE